MLTTLFAHVDVSAAMIRNLEPHDRTVCLALMREHGMGDREIAAGLGVGVAVVRQLLDTRHSFQLAKDRGQTVADEDDIARPTRGRQLPISKNAFAVLAKIAAGGADGIAASKHSLADMLDLDHKTIDRSISRLIDEGAVERLRPGTGGRAPIYAATEKGMGIVTALTAAGA